MTSSSGLGSFLSCGEEGSNSTAARRRQAISPVQRRRPQPAAETGRSCWGRVLIFQSPAKGLRKNQQTQPVQAPAVRFRQGSQRIGMSTKKDAARPFGLGTFFVVDGTGREPERAKAGYHRGDGILPFVLICFISRSQHPLQYSLRENSP